jgi:hypothetical protein
MGVLTSRAALPRTASAFAIACQREPALLPERFSFARPMKVKGFAEIFRGGSGAIGALSPVFRRACDGPACRSSWGGLACRGWARVTDVAKRRRQEL